MENQTDNLNDLLIKYSEGTMSSDDYEHLLDVLNHSSDEDVFNVLGMHWDSFSCGENKDFYHEKRVQLYESLSRKIRRHKRPEENKSTVETFVIWKWFWIAASFVLLAIGSWFVSNYMDNVRASDWDGQNVVVQSGTIGNSSVLLPDGSKVTLNAKSRLSYGADFGKNGRRVLLDGQGFFEVLHHDDNKFVVETKFMDITVYGTVFNVYAYEDNGIVEMSLLDGNVRVETKGVSSQCFNVQPNEKVTYNKATGEAFLEPTDNVLETAWMKDYLVFIRKLSEKNPDSKLMKAYMDAHVCSNVYTVQGGKAHSHYCHRAFCPICQRIQTAQNVKKFLPVMKYLASEGREFYFVTLTLQNCVTDDARVLRDFMRRCNRMWADGIRTKHKFRSLGISGVIKKECTYHVVKKDLFSFHYHFHIIVDSLEAAKYVVAQWKKLHGSTVADARFQKYKKIEDFENAAIEVFKYASKASVSKSKGRDGKKKIQINYKALDMIYTAMHGMQRMSSFGQFRTMIGDEALNDFRDEDLVLNIEGLNVEDGCYTWYMSVKDKVADWYNMETGEALCCYKVTRKDELLQDIYLDEDIFPNSG